MGDLLGALGGHIGGFLVDLVLPSLAAIIGGMVVKFLKAQLEKVGIEMTREQEQRVRDVTVDAVKGVEEKARRKSMSSTAKRDAALTEILTKVPELSHEDAAKAIDAALPEVRKQLTPDTPATFGMPK